MPPKKDLTNQKFGRLVVLEEAGRDKHGKVLWKCQCQCSEKSIVTICSNSLRTKHTQSCGCVQKEYAKKEKYVKHGQARKSSKNPIYHIWIAMFNRCYNPNNQAYHNYGGRGIRVCDRWPGENGFQNFYEDIGKYRKEGTTLDRINNDGDYEPSNCRWTTWEKQQQNTRSKGYHLNKRNGKYLSKIRVNKKTIYLGHFNTPEEARKAYIEAKRKYHGIDLEK